MKDNEAFFIIKFFKYFIKKMRPIYAFWSIAHLLQIIL